MGSTNTITLKDVAKHAQVSIMTVSAVLSGKAIQRRISASTQLRVEQSALLLGYRPNAIARSLRRRSTNVIGLYSGLGYLNASNPFLAELIGGLQEGCDSHCKDLLLLGTFRGLSVDDIYAEILNGRLDGLVVQAPHSDPLVMRLTASNLPVVALADSFPTVPSVVVDDAGGAEALANHMFARGHRSVIYAARFEPIESSERRRNSFISTAARLGMKVNEIRLRAEGEPALFEAVSSLRHGRNDRPTAVCCWCDIVAYRFLDYCHSYGVKVPGDVAVTGFDGFESLGARNRVLTTIRAPWSDVGRAAISLLAKMLAGAEAPPETVIPVEFMQGETT